MANTCMFCAEERETWALFACGHTSACFRCALRYRFKNSNKERSNFCLECQQKSDTVYLFWESDDPAAGENIRDEYWEGVTYESEDVLHEVERLVGLCCPLADTCQNYRAFNKSSELRNHLLAKHDVTFCAVCFEGRPLFPAEQPLYTKTELRQHESTTEHCTLDPTNFFGHPKCGFCSSLHLDADALYEHVHKKYLLCDICETSTDKKMVYYRGMAELMQHWRTSHYYCELCYEKHLGGGEHHPSEWAFKSDIDYAAHNGKAHSTGNKKSNVIMMGESSYSDRRTRTPPPVRERELDGAGGIGTERAAITFNMGRRPDVVVRMAFSGNQTTETSPTGGGRGKGKKGGKGVQDAGQSSGRGRGRGHAPAREEDAAPTPQHTREPNAKERNIALMNKMKVKFGNNLTKFNQLRVISSDFLKGQIQTVDYYDKLGIFFGGDLDDIFPELVDLLPDQNKQAGLRLAHSSANSTERGIPDVPNTAKTLQSKAKQQQQQQQQQSSQSQSSGGEGGPNANWLHMARGFSGGGQEADAAGAEFPSLSGKGGKPKGRGNAAAPKPKGKATPATSSAWLAAARK